ncbi:MAG TPA: DsbC family protein [Syntrophales bacterium]|nr:DsbC family protein [Syntrophales bacterium]
MNKKTILSICFVCLLLFMVCGTLHAETVEETLVKNFPGADFDSIKPTDIKGVYEVVKGSEIIYYVPDPGYVISGDIFDKEGVNITERRRNELAAAKAKGLPLDKAIKVGNGKNIVVEFTDPDCSYCRAASSFLSQRKDVTLYIFFFPLMSHQDAENKIKYIFCAKDRAKAYEDAMAGKLDDQKYEKCSKPEATDLLKLHKEIGQTMGIKGTPYFIINWKKQVMGANVEEIEGALEK